jgi:creatinine amidohydrolase
VGDPREGDADRGADLVAAAGAALADLLAAMAARDPTPLPHR